MFDDPLTFALTDPAEALFVTGIGEICEREGFGLVLIPGGPPYGSGGPPYGSGTGLVDRALVDGFICHCDLTDDGRVDAVAARGLPVVVVDGPARPYAGHVGIDDHAAAALAARHLVELGHRRIAVLTAPLHPDGGSGPADLARRRTTRFHVTRQRLAGCREELERAGIDWSEVPVIECAPYGREAGRSAAAALLDAGSPPTGLLAMADELALGALHAAAERGIDVPRRLSVVGFDDAPPAAWARPALTTVRQPHREKGRTAAEQVLGLRPRDPVRFETELVIRASTAQPPA